MAITDTAPTHAEADAANPPPAASDAAGGLAALVGTSDHKVIGRLFIGTSLLFILLAGICGELVSVDRVDQKLGNTILNARTYGEAASFHGIAGTFLFLIPLLLGIALVVVPLQVGARTVAFPRAAAASYWTFLISGGLLLGSYTIHGGPGGTSTKGTELWLVAMVGVLVALLLATVCVVTTVIALRTHGMDLNRAPLFSWSMLAAGSVWLLTLPVAIGELLLMYVDYRNGHGFWGASGSFNQHLEWLFGQPQVYVYAVPGLGIAADAIASVAGTRHSGHRIAMAALGLASLLGFGAFTVAFKNADVSRQALYVGMAFLILLPMFMLLGLWADTLRQGTIKVASPLVFGLGGTVLLLLGAIAGAAAAIDRFGLNGTAFNAGQEHLVLLGATMAGLGGLHYWATKIGRKPLSEALGVGSALLFLLGALVTSLPDIFSGAFGKGDDIALGIKGLNGVAAVGGVLVLLAVLVVIVNLLQGAKAGAEAAAADPWNGNTLEWLTASPPSKGNFDGSLPVVTSEAPLVDARAGKEASV